MDGFLITIIGFGAIAFFCWILWLIRNKNVDYTIHKKKEQVQEEIIDGTQKELELLSKIKSLFDSSIALQYSDIYDYINYCPSVDELPLKDNSKVAELFSNYCYQINNRYFISHYKLNPLESIYNINLKQGEQIYYSVYDSQLYDSKNLYKYIDIGTIHLTNKRLLFIGDNLNTTKSYNYKNIITFKKYLDGISVSISNQNPKIFKFEQSKDNLFIQDGLTELKILLPRFINDNYNQDLI